MMTQQAWRDELRAAGNDTRRLAIEIKEMIAAKDFDSLRNARIVGIPTHPSLGEQVSIDIIRCLFNMSTESIWLSESADGPAPAPHRHPEDLPPHEKRAWEFCADWFDAIPAGASGSRERAYRDNILSISLARAASAYQIGAVDFLMDRGADPLALQRYTTHVHTAANTATTEVVEILPCALSEMIRAHKSPPAHFEKFLSHIMDRMGAANFEQVDARISINASSNPRKGADAAPDDLESVRLFDHLCREKDSYLIRIDWLRHMLPESYMAPRLQLWEGALHCRREIAKLVAARVVMKVGKSYDRKPFEAPINALARYLIAGATPPGDSEARASAWNDFLHSPLEIRPASDSPFLVTPNLLHAIAIFDCVEPFRLRIFDAIAEAGALDINVLRQGTTLLHDLVSASVGMGQTRENTKKTIVYILDAGARVDIENASGANVMDRARELGDVELSNMFAAHAAKKAMADVMNRVRLQTQP